MTQWAQSSDISLRYEVSGRGSRSLILIHELAGTSESWDYVTPRLEPDFRILRSDQRGAGLSEKVRAPFTLADLVADTDRVVEASGLQPPFYVAGVASGAAIAVAYALQRPRDVRALALCAPALQANPERSRYLLERSERAMREGMRAIIDVVFERSYPEEVIRDRAIYDEYRARFLAIDPVCYAHANRVLAEVTLEEALSSLDCPTLLLAGQHDRMRPADHVSRLLARLKHGTFDTIDSGHIMILQAPDLFGERLSAFFLKAGS